QDQGDDDKAHNDAGDGDDYRFHEGKCSFGRVSETLVKYAVDLKKYIPEIAALFSHPDHVRHDLRQDMYMGKNIGDAFSLLYLIDSRLNGFTDPFVHNNPCGQTQ